MTIRQNTGKSAKTKKPATDGIKNAKRKNYSESLRLSTSSKIIKALFYEDKK